MRRKAKLFMNDRSQAVRLPCWTTKYRPASLALMEYLRHVEVQDFPDEAALHVAPIRAALMASGAMIGANDLFIAAHARSV